MNERNVEELCCVILGFGGPDGYLARLPDMIRLLATHLAANGVLAPRVLTYEDCLDVVQDWDDGEYFGGTGNDDILNAGRVHVQQELERIARGAA